MPLNHTPLQGQRVLIFVGDDYEDMELQYPKYRLLEAGAEVLVAGLEANQVYHGKHGYPQKSQAKIADVRADDFDAVVIPGGWMPDKLRRYDEVKRIVKQMDEADKCVASICHGPWIDISAGIVKGRTYTSTRALMEDLQNAGATWVDEPVVVDGNRVSSRRPDDLPAFCRSIIDVMAARAPSGAASA
ncbi:MAG: type 1 glutamine amidotransferase domain-containing protein [Phycisphaeraceae bacterium]